MEPGRLTPGRCSSRRPGGHDEGLRRSRGEAAGEKLGTDPVDRSVVNVGTILGLPSPPTGQVGEGRLVVSRWPRDGTESS